MAWLRDRSLAWNLAYCEGFESTGLIQSEFFLQEIDDLLVDADPAVHELWAWHLAEEFEHRNVAHDVLEALCGMSEVRSVHDLHVWSVGSGQVSLSCHIVVPQERETLPVLRQVYALLGNRFGIDHATIQMELK